MGDREAESRARDSALVAEVARFKPAVRRRVLGLFLRDAPVLVDSLGRAIELHDQTALLARAHTLKSNSGTLGAMRLSELCRELELLGKRSDFGAASRLFPDLLREFSAVAGEFSRAIHELGGNG